MRKTKVFMRKTAFPHKKKLWFTRKVKKAFLKRTADFFEKCAVVSAGVGVFQHQNIGLWIAIICVLLSFLFTYLEIIYE